LRFQVNEDLIEFEPEVVIVAGFTGRDGQQVHDHIAELIEEGVTAPEEIPSFYPLPPSILTQAERLDVLNRSTSGEAEIALLFDGSDTFVTLASDHTDRRAEMIDIYLSKQVCPKPIATTAWEYDEVVGHWDELQLRSWIEEAGSRHLYQEGSAAAILPPTSILNSLRWRHRPESYALLTGTVPVRGGIRSSGHFWAELTDPVRQNSLQLNYRIQTLEMLET
jgi:hypothetical protein